MEINPENPFQFDLLGRKEEIENLTSLAINVNSPAVIAIDSRWGTGKTTFIKMWEQYLISESISVLYFNAWETDFSDDPLVSFLGEMNEGLKELIEVSDTANKAWEKAKSVGKQIAKRGIPALIKIGTGGILDADKIIEDELSKVAGALASDALNNYLEQKDLIVEFHNAFAEFVENSSNDKQLIIFVDELDRCRPNYAIELLERIKHLFDIEGIVFVLALDKTQLGHSIGAIYGSDIDSDGYLRRFIDFEYRLKKPKIRNYINSLFSALQLESYFNLRKKYRELQYDQDHLIKVFHMLASGLGLSLREIEQLLANINLVVRTAKENEYLHPALMVFLLVSKYFQPEKYLRYINDNMNSSELISYLYEIVPEKKRKDNFECALVEGFLIAVKRDNYTKAASDCYLRHKAIIENEDMGYDEKKYSEIVINVADRPAGMGHHVDLKKISERIDWLSQFKFSEKES